LRVLIVEDEADLAQGLRLGFEAEGWAVDVAADGVEGLWRAQENPYDILVIDIMLPKLGGYELCRRLRAGDDWTPILFLTAKDGLWDQVEGLDLGGDDYLVKPAPFALLMARVRALIRRGAPQRPAIIEAGGIQFDPATRRAWRGTTALELTARELSVLEYLMRRAGELVTKQELLAGVWDEAFDGDPNIAEVYVLRLRNKIDRPFNVGSIETVRGAGYRMARHV
jgi:DNA-binding response OmpR family regulator